MMSPQGDTSFEGRSDHFESNIYAQPKGYLRENILFRDILDHIPLHQSSLRVLDCGAGTGRLALRLLEMGHRVTLNDLSADMLNNAKERIQAKYPNRSVRCIHGPLQEIQVESGDRFDIVMCHAVLEWLESPLEAIVSFARLLKPGGHLSLMFYNLHGLQFHKVIKTHYFHITDPSPMKRQSRFTPSHPLIPDQVLKALIRNGFEIKSKAGIRNFFDYIENGDQFESIPPHLFEMEMALKNAEPFWRLGRYIHITAIRNAG